MEDSTYSETMLRVAKIFNIHGIRYALVGGVLAELRRKRIRVHKDVDFAVYEEDMQRIKEILEINDISCSSEIITLGEDSVWADNTNHNVTGKDLKTGVDIGFFLYTHQKDQYCEGEIVSQEGFLRKSYINYRGVNLTLRERMPAELEEYLFDPNRYEEYDGVQIKVQPLAYTLMIKSQNLRQKDIEDLKDSISLITPEEYANHKKYGKHFIGIHTTAQIGRLVEGECDEVKDSIDRSPEEFLAP